MARFRLVSLRLVSFRLVASQVSADFALIAWMLVYGKGLVESMSFPEVTIMLGSGLVSLVFVWMIQVCPPLLSTSGPTPRAIVGHACTRVPIPLWPHCMQVSSVGGRLAIAGALSIARED
jgi:hypothetical protein